MKREADISGCQDFQYKFRRKTYSLASLSKKKVLKFHPGFTWEEVTSKRTDGQNEGLKFYMHFIA